MYAHAVAVADLSRLEDCVVTRQPPIGCRRRVLAITLIRLILAEPGTHKRDGACAMVLRTGTLEQPEGPLSFHRCGTRWALILHGHARV